MNEENIDDCIDACMLLCKRGNRIPQHMELSPDTKQRLKDMLENYVEKDPNNQDWLEAILLGFIVGYGHLFHQVSTMLSTGMIKRMDK